MKRIHHIIITILALIGLSSCTHNNGDIGPWFGTWKVAEITINGSPDSSYAGNLFWSFQTSVIGMTEINPTLGVTTAESWGSWEQQGDILRLNFTNTDDANPEQGSSKYSPRPSSHLPVGVSELQILSLSSSAVSLRYIASDGSIYEYSLKKW